MPARCVEGSRRAAWPLCVVAVCCEMPDEFALCVADVVCGYLEKRSVRGG